ILDLEPDFFDLPDDELLAYGAAGGAFMSWSLSRNFDVELLRAQVAEALGWEAMVALFPSSPSQPEVVVAGKDGGATGRRSALDLLKSAVIHPSGQGSNNWVVAG